MLAKYSIRTKIISVVAFAVLVGMPDRGQPARSRNAIAPLCRASFCDRAGATIASTCWRDVEEKKLDTDLATTVGAPRSRQAYEAEDSVAASSARLYSRPAVSLRVESEDVSLQGGPARFPAANRRTDLT